MYVLQNLFLVALCGPLLFSTATCRPGQAETAASAPDWNDILQKRPAFARGWKYIIVHHSATARGSATEFHAYHTKMNYGGLAYHFVIGNGNGTSDGQVEQGFRWKRQMAGTHVYIDAWHHNIFGIGICLVGDFNQTRPTAKQTAALIKLCRQLSAKYKIPRDRLLDHKEVPLGDIDWTHTQMTVTWKPGKKAATTCPGRHLNMEYLRRLVFSKSRGNM